MRLSSWESKALCRGLASEPVFGGKVPAIDVSETDAGVDATAELPGVDEADVDANVDNRVLTIRGEKRAEKETKIAIGKG